MNAISAYWTPEMNILIIECSCGETIHHKLRYSLVECPKCRAVKWYSKEFESFNDKYTNADTIKWNRFNRSGASKNNMSGTQRNKFNN